MRSINLELIEENEGLSIKLLVYHHPKNAHLSCTAIVQLPSPQVNHVSLAPCVWSKSNREFSGTCCMKNLGIRFIVFNHDFIVQ
jgi:hypothetical protein